MNIIINDLSLEKQFNDLEVFYDSLAEVTIPMLNLLEELNIEILKSYNTYSKMITPSHSLFDVLKQKRLLTEVARLKLLLLDPYWEDEMKCSEENIYGYLGEVGINCLAEALEREIPVISFEHDEFKKNKIYVNKNQVEYMIENFYCRIHTLEYLRMAKVISPLEYIVNKYNLKDSFGKTIGKNYLDELIENANLLDEDISVILDDMDRLIFHVERGSNPGRLSESIEGKLKEFRTTLTNSREIRIFYFEKNNRITFLRGFLKKGINQQQLEIKKAKELMKKII